MLYSTTAFYYTFLLSENRLNIIISQFDLSIVYILTYGMFFILFANQQYIIRFSDEVAFQSVDDGKFVLRKNDNIIFAIV